MKIFKEYSLEIKRLKNIYNGSVKSYLHYSQHIKKHMYDEGNIATEAIYLHTEIDENHYIAGNQYEYIRRLQKGYATSLREILLIRLISNLEVFLIKAIREIFLHRKDLFHKDGVIEFNHSELLSAESISQLWTKLINKECRNLQNQGFKEVTKYYAKTFNIELHRSEVSLKNIEKLHDIRHLLVHRLGVVDTEFSHKYNTKIKSVTISETEFYECCENLKKLAEFIKLKYEEIIAQKATSGKKTNSSTANYTISFLTPTSEFLTSDNYSFLSKEKYLMLKDVLSSRIKNESSVLLELVGHKDDLIAYENSLKQYITAGNIEITKKIKKTSPFDWFTTQEIAYIESEMIKGDIEDGQLIEIVDKLKISKSKIVKLIIAIKQSKT